MKILHVYRTYFPDPPGGLQEVIRQICHSQQYAGITNRVFTLTTDDNTPLLERSECTVIRSKQWLEIASCSIGYPGAIQSFKEQVAWADVVHYHFPWPFADILHLLGQVKKPSVLTYHSDIVRQRGLMRIYQPLMHYFLSRVDRIVTTSPNYLASSDILQRYRHKTDVIPIGLDEAAYPEPCWENSPWQSMITAPYLLFIGVLRYYKGLEFLLEAMVDASYQLIIAGSGPCEGALKEKAKTLNLHNVLFTGFVSEAQKMALLQDCVCLVFPSQLRSEAFGVSLLEAAMSHKPSISCEIGTGTSYVNQHESTGLVVPPADAGALRKAMDHLTSRPEQSQQWGESAYKRYQSHFTGAIMGQHYTNLYQVLYSLAQQKHNHTER